MAAIIETEEPIHSVHIDGLAVLKIVKHCQESLPNLVSGSLLGLTVQNGILEITHAFPFPENRDETSATPSADAEETTTALDGDAYQLEMMKMLREVNVDNNCVGWYQSMNLGMYSTADLLTSQLNYQTELSSNAVVMLYDPMQTTHGNLVLKCLRLTKEAIDMVNTKKNIFLDPKNIFEEVPITMKNPSLVKALLHSVAAGEYSADADDDLAHSLPAAASGAGTLAAEIAPKYKPDTTFDRLDLSTNPYLEKHLEFMCTWVEDLEHEQNKFQGYMRNLSRAAGMDSRGRFDKRNKDKAVASINAQEAWASAEAPKRLESLLISNQIRSYCDQVDKFADGGFGKLFVVDGLHRDEKRA